MADNTVLIVDDEKAFADGLADVLKTLGFAPVVCTQPEQAVDVALAHQPRFVLLDIYLGGMDGFQVAVQLRQRPELKGAAIIAMSAYFEKRPYEFIAEQCGIQSFLTKPFRHEDLVAHLDSAKRAMDGTAAGL